MDICSGPSVAFAGPATEERRRAICAISNNLVRFVRELHARGSGASVSSSRRKSPHNYAPEGVTDRRIERTRRQLNDALGALIGAKAYERITVSEILQRANVGRSTFYTHFRDKDELLVSHIHDMLRAFRPLGQSSEAALPERILAFSFPFLEHIQHHRHLGAPKMGERGRTVLHEYVRRVLAERIIQDLDAESGRRQGSGDIEPSLLAQYIASTFVLVLHWWMDRRNTVSAADADKSFRTLVLPALGTVRSVPRPERVRRL